MTYTREQVVAALNASADLVHHELNLSDRDGDLLNLMVNAVATLLDGQAADFDAVVTTNYSAPPHEVCEWWSSWREH